MQWQPHRVRGPSFDNKEIIPWPRIRNLDN